MADINAACLAAANALQALQSSTKYIETFLNNSPLPPISMLKRQHTFIRVYCTSKTPAITLAVKF